jgi:chromate transporter
MSAATHERVSLPTIVREWTRIGCLGFGGPPAHIALLRRLCVDQRAWLSAAEFEDGIAAVNLLPGPASTQLAIYCAWRLRGTRGALLGGACFIVPGLIAILVLAALFLAAHTPLLVRGAAAGAGAAVAAVALQAAVALLPASRRRATGPGRRRRWAVYLVVGGAAAALVGPYLVLVLAACGLIEIVAQVRNWPAASGGPLAIAALRPLVLATAGGLAALSWVAFKVGALSYGGGFVIIPLMQRDAVHTYHWMSGAQFLEAVALGQITPGPVIQTVAVVGYTAAGLGGGLLAALVAFAPSFVFVIAGAPHFDRLRRNQAVQAFLSGAGAAAIGAIAGAALPLALSLSQLWQLGVLLLAAIWLLALRRGVVSALCGAGLLGVAAALAGLPIPH